MFKKKICSGNDDFHVPLVTYFSLSVACQDENAQPGRGERKNSVQGVINEQMSPGDDFSTGMKPRFPAAVISLAGLADRETGCVETVVFLLGFLAEIPYTFGSVADGVAKRRANRPANHEAYCG